MSERAIGGQFRFDAAALWRLAPPAVLAYGLALLGRAAPQWRGRAWLRAYAHGLWNLFDLTPEGRPDWDEPISYP